MKRTGLYLLLLILWCYCPTSWGDEGGVNSEWQQRSRLIAGRAATLEMAVPYQPRQPPLYTATAIDGKKVAMSAAHAARELVTGMMRHVCQHGECKGIAQVLEGQSGVLQKATELGPSQTAAVMQYCVGCGGTAEAIAQTVRGRLVFRLVGELPNGPRIISGTPASVSHVKEAGRKASENLINVIHAHTRSN